MSTHIIKDIPNFFLILLSSQMFDPSNKTKNGVHCCYLRREDLTHERIRKDLLFVQKISNYFFFSQASGLYDCRMHGLFRYTRKVSQLEISSRYTYFKLSLDTGRFILILTIQINLDYFSILVCPRQCCITGRQKNSNPALKLFEDRG